MLNTNKFKGLFCDEFFTILQNHIKGCDQCRNGVQGCFDMLTDELPFIGTLLPIDEVKKKFEQFIISPTTEKGN